MFNEAISSKANSVTTSSKLNSGIEKAEGDKKKLANLFNNYSEVKTDVIADSKNNKKAVQNIKENVKNSTESAKAAKKASNKAKSVKKSSSWGNYTIASNPKASNNTVTFSIKDKNGKKGTANVAYADDGSRIVTVKINNKTREIFYDSNGKVRQKSTLDTKSNKKTTQNCDSTGKINYKETINTETGLKISSDYYDDNGQLSRKNTYNDDGKLKAVKDYEYDKNGNLLAKLVNIKEGSKLSGKVDSIVSTYYKNGDTKTVKRYNTDGTVLETGNTTTLHNSKSSSESVDSEILISNVANMDNSRIDIQPSRGGAIGQVDWKNLSIAPNQNVDFGYKNVQQTVIDRKIGGQESYIFNRIKGSSMYDESQPNSNSPVKLYRPNKDGSFTDMDNPDGPPVYIDPETGKIIEK